MYGTIYYLYIQQVMDGLVAKSGALVTVTSLFAICIMNFYQMQLVTEDDTENTMPIHIHV